MHEYRRAVRRTRMVYIKITGFQKKIDGLHKAKETHEIQLKVLFFSSYLLFLLLSFLPRSSLHQSDWLLFFNPRACVNLFNWTDFKQAQQENSELQKKEEEKVRRLETRKQRKLEAKQAVAESNLQRYKDFQGALSTHRQKRIQRLEAQSGEFITMENLMSRINATLAKTVSYNNPVTHKSKE